MSATNARDTEELVCFVCCTDLQEQQEELRQRRRSAEDSSAATSRHIRQTDPKLRCARL